MRVLLVQPASPPTYWGYQQTLPLIGKGAPLPPLGLATLAALLPERWELRIHDLQLRPLRRLGSAFAWDDPSRFRCSDARARRADGTAP